MSAIILATSSTVVSAGAQVPVQYGSATIASMPPTYKAKTEQNGPGFNATMMLSRKIFADEVSGTTEGLLEIPGHPIPTNDWWTDIINNRYSGALWSYPAMLRTSEDGVEINYPTYWADYGKEMKSLTTITVGAKKYIADATIAKDWHDWDVVFRMPSAKGNGEMTITSMHGTPFTWFEFSGLAPILRFNMRGEQFDATDTYCGIKLGQDKYGVYYPSGKAPVTGEDGTLEFEAGTEWIVVSLLRTEEDLSTFARYASSIPRDTKVSWNYDETSGKVNSIWSIKAENLRDKHSDAPVLQGYLPHAYKYMLPGATLHFIDNEGFKTPRGKMKLATSESGDFQYSYQFSGMLPAYGAPLAGNTDTHGFRQEVLDKLMADYASQAGFGGDTYWGGKSLVQMAMNMNFAKQTGNMEVYEESKRKLKEAFIDWLTYTPGENSHFFSYYPRWGAMLGFDVSYDSDAFNDHHFHYGYFTYAAALLCMEDKEFAAAYSEVLTMIAKDYANWDREDNRFPFMRTLDPWCGHSWAGGLGDHGNDNGNGQESTSEAMQGWGGIYLLGVALGNKEMRDAGLWGWSTEARATREYWYDIDSPRGANAGGRQPWPGKGERQGNYDYNEYPYAYNSNITGKGIGWWTWFGGDPLFMHGIQWMPVSPALDYLSWDKDFVGWAFHDMMSGANSSFSHEWFTPTANKDNGETIEPLAANDWGNVALAYLERNDPLQAASIFDEALERNMHIATAVSTSHISYYVIHSHLTYGDPDFSIHADIPTAQVREKDGVRTYLVYNPSDADRTVNFFDASGKQIKSVTAPANKLAAINTDPVATKIEYSLCGGTIAPPGNRAEVTYRTLDQYGAGMPAETCVLTLSDGAPAIIIGHELKIDENAKLGDKFTLTISNGSLREEIPITVNDTPVAQTSMITGLPEICEAGVVFEVELRTTDQYGTETTPPDTRWQYAPADGGEIRELNLPASIAEPGKYTITAISETLNAETSAEIFITPSLPKISAGALALASSAENAGSLPQGATDGDMQVRWGSKHTDDEWLVIDLGENCDISRISINWETAFASRYLLQAAPDGCKLTTKSVDYAGTTKSVTVPTEESWQTLKEKNATSAGDKTTAVQGNGRYIRMKGLSRGTQYGYSLYEMSIYGIKGSTRPDDIIGIAFSMPPAINSEETLLLEPKAFNRKGESTLTPQIEWSSDKEAEFTGNRFTPHAHGIYTITATIPRSDCSTSSTIFVNEVERIDHVTTDKQEYEVITGEPAIITYTVMNQFLAPYTGNIENLEIHVLDKDGIPTAEATYDMATQTFMASESGTYSLDFGGYATCSVTALALSEFNIALGKEATASSANGGNKASMAVDGKTDTRWESIWEENQTLTVDLEEKYNVNRVNILWEGAYAKEYRLQSSDNGKEWTDFYTQRNSHGGSEELTFAPVTMQYIRLCCDKRALPSYGHSLYEFEVYALGKADNGESSVAGITDSEEKDIRWFTIQGIPVTKPSAPGLYIRLSGNSSEVVRL